jgi:hypothetical protein
LLKGQPRRFGDEAVFPRARVFGECTGRCAEHLIAGLEARDVPADRLDSARDVHATDGDSRPAQAEEHAAGERHVDEVRIEGIDGRRVHPNEHTVIRDRGHVDLAQLENVGRPVTFLDDRSHGRGSR